MFTYTCSVLNDAAQEGVRYAIIHGTDSAVCSGPDTGCTNQTPYSNVQAVVTAAASCPLSTTPLHMTDFASARWHQYGSDKIPSRSE